MAVRVEELTERTRPERLYIRATIFVEQDSQKGILIGKGGGDAQAHRQRGPPELEALLRHQGLPRAHVQVRRNWRKDERALREFGFLLTS